MACERITDGDGRVVGFICTRGRRSRPKPCVGCGKPSTRLCDTRVANGARSKTCDAPLCDACTFSPREGVDCCPRHRREPTPPEQLEEKLAESVEHEKEKRMQAATNPPLKAPGDDGLINELSWSKSRASKLAECPRAYWLHYYGAWGGWDRRASERARRLYMLKNLESRSSWVGHSVHAAAKRSIEAELRGEMVDVGAAIADVRAQMLRQLQHSKRGMYRTAPKKSLGLIEHHYGITTREEYYAEALDQAAEGVRTLLGSTTYARASMSERVLPVDEMDGFDLAGTKVYVAPDLAFQPPERPGLELVDWKTGRPRPEDSDQVVTYAAYAQVKHGIAPERVTGRLVYVQGGDLQEPSFQVEASDLTQWREDTLVSIGKMRSMHGAPEEAFDRTTNTRTCQWCNFRGECWPEGQVKETT